VIYSIEMASCSMLYLPSFMKIDTGVRAILRSGLRFLRGFNIDVTDGRVL
jgi:hypothetical protein